ncbi:hypothetical protein ACW9HH_35955 [Nocardia gipuzkoensis]
MKDGFFVAVPIIDANQAAEALDAIITESFFCMLEKNPKGISLLVLPFRKPSPHQPGHATAAHKMLTVLGVIDTTGGCGSVQESTPDNWQEDFLLCPETAVAVVIVDDAEAPEGHQVRLETVDVGPDGFKRKPGPLHWGGMCAGTPDPIFTDVLERVTGRPNPTGLLPVYDRE